MRTNVIGLTALACLALVASCSNSKPASPKSKEVSTTRNGLISVIANPAETVIRVPSRQQIGFGRISLPEDGIGARVCFSLPGYLPEDRIFDGKSLTVKMRPDSITVSITSNTHAEVRYLPYGGVIGTTPCTFVLPSGKHTLELLAPYQKPIQKTFEAAAGHYIDIAVQKPKSTLLRPVVAPEISGPKEFMIDRVLPLSWSAVSSAREYEVALRQIDVSQEYTMCGRIDVPEFLYNPQAIQPGDIAFRVRALNAAGSGPWSKDHIATATASDHTAGDNSTTASPPTDLVMLEAPLVADPGDTVLENSSYELVWSPVSGAEYYDIDESSEPEFLPRYTRRLERSQAPKIRIQNAPGDASRLYYRVRACVAGRCGPWTGTVTTKQIVLNVIFPEFGALSVLRPGGWAYVTLGGDDKKETPAFYDRVPCGEHEITIDYPNGTTEVRKIEVVGGGTTVVRI
ncbi:MAG: hypothetical protein IH621_01665 [Krumholzibacteria bacterium]|nr:hypothetical protein [Candidatus Krumholzibacteria bacterium]